MNTQDVTIEPLIQSARPGTGERMLWLRVARRGRPADFAAQLLLDSAELRNVELTARLLDIQFRASGCWAEPVFGALLSECWLISAPVIDVGKAISIVKDELLRVRLLECTQIGWFDTSEQICREVWPQPGHLIQLPTSEEWAREYEHLQATEDRLQYLTTLLRSIVSENPKPEGKQ